MDVLLLKATWFSEIEIKKDWLCCLQVSHLLLEVPSVTQVKSDDLDQRHQQQNCHQDELVIVW